MDQTFFQYNKGRFRMILDLYRYIRDARRLIKSEKRWGITDKCESKSLHTQIMIMGIENWYGDCSNMYSEDVTKVDSVMHIRLSNRITQESIICLIIHEAIHAAIAPIIPLQFEFIEKVIDDWMLGAVPQVIVHCGFCDHKSNSYEEASYHFNNCRERRKLINGIYND